MRQVLARLVTSHHRAGFTVARRKQAVRPLGTETELVPEPENHDDWRMTGQERYLRGAVLRRAQYTAPSPEWDHDHCAFCWAKFMPGGVHATLADGYTTLDRHHWICSTCFDDFRDSFEWSVIPD